MLLAQCDDIVDALATDCSDQPLGKTILPQRAWRNGLVADAHGPQAARDGSAVDPVLIADQIARSLVPRKRLGNLARDPFCCRMWSYVDPHQFSAGEPDDHQNIQQVKADG